MRVISVGTGRNRIVPYVPATVTLRPRRVTDEGLLELGERIGRLARVALGEKGLPSTVVRPPSRDWCEASVGLALGPTPSPAGAEPAVAPVALELVAAGYSAGDVAGERGGGSRHRRGVGRG
jgi:hypothetical protein